MARSMTNFRQTQVTDSKDLGSTGGPTKCFKIAPIDSEQVPSGYLESLKVSVIDVAGNANNSFLVYMTTDDSAVVGKTITAGATGNGGGTVWLKAKRSIRSSEEEEDRNDGAVYVWIASQNRSVGVNIVCEAWGRFIELTRFA